MPEHKTQSNTLGWWLNRLEQMQPDRIELGLARIHEVASRCGLDEPDFQIITVAGTNGKGSTVEYCAGILQHSGKKVGVYTSPHFVHFNERIVINGSRADERSLCEAFHFVDSHRGDTELTYFEFTTLAAMHCFKQSNIEVAVLEVGLGGRLDAVNAWQSDVACVTSIGIDHVDWIGNDRESIGYEKACVARAGRPLICGDKRPPTSIAKTVSEIGAQLIQVNIDFSVAVSANSWSYKGPRGKAELPMPAIDAGWAVDNAAVAISACAELLGHLPDRAALERAVTGVVVPGRMQQLIFRGVPVLLDVAHNEQAAERLAEHLDDASVPCIAVFACMQDKDALAIVQKLSTPITRWLVADLDFPRAIDAHYLADLIRDGEHGDVEVFTSVIQAFEAGVAQSGGDIQVVVFGSFHVVGPVLELLASHQ